MTTVFISGSRRLSRLDRPFNGRLQTIIERQFPVLIGDANGADKAVQAYFRNEGYSNVEVYCTGATCRNNLGGWPVNHVSPGGLSKQRNRAFFTVKDRAMSEKASHGLMLWDGASLGTLVNVIRLNRTGRLSVVYVQPTRAFVNVRTAGDVAKLGSYCSSELIEQASHAVDSETRDERQRPQATTLALF